MSIKWPFPQLFCSPTTQKKSEMESRGMILLKVQPNVSKSAWVGWWGLRGCGLCKALTLTLGQTLLLHLATTASSSSSFSWSFFLPPAAVCLAPWDRRPITPESSDTISSCSRGEWRQPRGCRAKGKHLYSVIHLIVIPHSSAPRPLRQSPRSDLLCLTVCLSEGIC